MTAFDDRKIKQKESTAFMQVAADTLYQTRRNMFIKLLLSSYDKNANCKPYKSLILTTENDTSAFFK